jgi:hypothetical protein
MRSDMTLLALEQFLADQQNTDQDQHTTKTLAAIFDAS